MKPKPRQHIAVWSATAESVTERRSKVVRRVLSPERKAADWMEKRRLDRDIKRLFRAQEYLCRQIVVLSLRKDASSPSFAEFAARIKKIYAASDKASGLGDNLKPRKSTHAFADKQIQQTSLPLHQYTLHAEIKIVTCKKYAERRKARLQNRTEYR